jgi:DNA-binding transcriptional LysR family regulator
MGQPMPCEAPSPSRYLLPIPLEKLRGLRSLAAVMAHGGIAGAADALCLTRASVSRSLGDLEERCGAQLLQRIGRGTHITSLGEHLARRAATVFELLQVGAEEAANAQGANPTPSVRSRARRFGRAVSSRMLKAILCLEAEGSERSAARRLQIGQTSVHRALVALEHLAGAALFVRTSHGSTFTPSGSILLHRIKLAVREAEAFEEDLRAWQGERTARVVIGIAPATASILLSKAVAMMRGRAPRLDFVVIEGAEDMLLRRLRDGEIDLMIGLLREERDDLLRVRLCEAHLTVLARTGHPCALEAALVPEHLGRWDCIWPVRGSAAALVWQRGFVSAECGSPKPILETSSHGLVHTLLSSSDQIALVVTGPDDAAPHGLTRSPVRTSPQSDWFVGAAVRRQAQPVGAVLQTLQCLQAAAPEPSFGDALNDALTTQIAPFGSVLLPTFEPQP